MVEIFQDVPQEVKDIAETAWKVALLQKNPMEAAQFLDNVVKYFAATSLEDEAVDFLRFYFNMRMEQEMGRE